MADLAKRTRIPVKFSVICYEAQHHAVPGGRTVDIPRHWRLVASDGAVLGSGPYESEGTVLALIKMAGEYMREHPQDARAIMVNSSHMRVRVALPSPAQSSEVQ